MRSGPGWSPRPRASRSRTRSRSRRYVPGARLRARSQQRSRREARRFGHGRGRGRRARRMQPMSSSRAGRTPRPGMLSAGGVPCRTDSGSRTDERRAWRRAPASGSGRPSARAGCLRRRDSRSRRSAASISARPTPSSWCRGSTVTGPIPAITPRSSTNALPSISPARSATSAGEPGARQHLADLEARELARAGLDREVVSGRDRLEGVVEDPRAAVGILGSRLAHESRPVRSGSIVSIGAWHRLSS